MASPLATPNASMVGRHPKPAIPNAISGGHSAPAMYWPLDTSAMADPRRRSNQRVM